MWAHYELTGFSGSKSVVAEEAVGAAPAESFGELAGTLTSSVDADFWTPGGEPMPDALPSHLVAATRGFASGAMKLPSALDSDQCEHRQETGTYGEWVPP